VKKGYWWPGMGTDVRKYVDGCVIYQQMKVVTHLTAPKWFSSITFKFQLLTSWKVHPMFYASELVSYQEMEVHGLNYTEPPPDLINGEEHYEVEVIIQYKGTGSCQRSLVT
jgi:hypothetical protein